jgi:hypothetical protein
MSSVDSEVEARLRERFQTLATALEVHNLRFVWLPSQRRGLSGEVQNGVLYVYESDEEKAAETLKHELVDYVLTSRVVSPLVGLVNLLIKHKETEIYREKEKIVDLLSNLF